MIEKHDILSIPQAAQYCLNSRTSLWRWVKAGKLKAYKTPSGRYHILKNDLDIFLKENMPHLIASSNSNFGN